MLIFNDYSLQVREITTYLTFNVLSLKCLIMDLNPKYLIKHQMRAI